MPTAAWSATAGPGGPILTSVKPSRGFRRTLATEEARRAVGPTGTRKRGEEGRGPTGTKKKARRATGPTGIKKEDRDRPLHLDNQQRPHGFNRARGDGTSLHRSPGGHLQA